MRQARNFENEMRAIEIRIWAERRCGKLLAEMVRAQGKRSDLVTSPQAGAKSFKDQRNEYGISRTQAYRWQKLAAVPEEEFESTFARPEKPSTTGIINRGSEKKRDVVDPRALWLCWLWGRLLDFERDGLLGADPEEICATIFCDSGYRKPAAGRYRRHPNRERPDCRDPSCAQSIGSAERGPGDGRGGAGLSDRPRLLFSRRSVPNVS